MNGHKLKILFANIGYARGISGSLAHHLRYAHRHFYSPPVMQKTVLRQVAEMIAREDPDIACLVEVDKGSAASGGFNQIEALAGGAYSNFDIENKYGPTSRLRKFPLTRGNSNAFLSKRNLPHEKIYFSRGAKRLVYKIGLEKNLTLFFAHFSLKKAIRARQILEVERLMKETGREVIFLGDFNILDGLSELMPLLDPGHSLLLNPENTPTFTFHKSHLMLDLCISSASLAPRLTMRIIPQPYSDHAALVVEVEQGQSQG